MDAFAVHRLLLLRSRGAHCGLARTSTSTWMRPRRCHARTASQISQPDGRLACGLTATARPRVHAVARPCGAHTSTRPRRSSSLQGLADHQGVLGGHCARLGSTAPPLLSLKGRQRSRAVWHRRSYRSLDSPTVHSLPSVSPSFCLSCFCPVSPSCPLLVPTCLSHAKVSKVSAPPLGCTTQQLLDLDCTLVGLSSDAQLSTPARSRLRGLGLGAGWDSAPYHRMLLLHVRLCLHGPRTLRLRWRPLSPAPPLGLRAGALSQIKPSSFSGRRL